MSRTATAQDIVGSIPRNLVDDVLAKTTKGQAALDAAVERWNKKYGYLESGGHPFMELQPDGSVTFLPKERFVDATKTDWVWVETSKGTKKQYIFPAWLDNPCRPTFKGVEFRPALATGPVRVEGTDRFNWNIAPGWAVKPLEGDCSVILEHIRTVLCRGDDARFQWLTQWLAAIFQRPEEPLGTGLALTGAGGTGKSWLDVLLGDLLGPMHLTVDKTGLITERFNAHLAKCLVVGCEEAFFSGNPQARGVIKSTMTAKKLFIEPKGVDGFQIDNLLRYIVYSNELKKCIPVGWDDERRWTVFQVSAHRKGDRAYFNALFPATKTQAPAFLHYLLALKVDLDLIRDKMDTPELHAMQREQERIEPVAACIRDILDAACVPGDWLGCGSTKKQTLADAFRRKWRTKFDGPQHDQTFKQEFARAIRELVPEMKKATVREHGKPREFCLPSLITLRFAWAEKYGPVEWGTEAKPQGDGWWPDDREPMPDKYLKDSSV